MRRIDMSKDKAPREFIKPQEIVELSPDGASEGEMYIGVQGTGYRCDDCDLDPGPITQCPLVRSICGFRLCAQYNVYLKSLDKALEDL